MAYKIVNANKRIDGSHGWRLVRTTWDVAKQKETTAHVKQRDWARLGVRKDMTRQEAEAHCKAVNQADRRARREDRVRLAITNADGRAAASMWLPPTILPEFESQLDNFKIRPVIWALAKRLILAVDKDPMEWFMRSGDFHAQIIQRALSRDTAERLWHALRTYVGVYAFRMGRVQFVPLPKIPTSTMHAIEEAYWAASKGKYVIIPMTEELLATCRRKLDPLYAAYFEVAYRFGLRPHEAAAVLRGPNPELWFIEDAVGQPYPWALHVYQTKLEKKGIHKDARWKAIPACEPEQQALRDVLLKGAYKLPPKLSSIQSKVGARVKLRSPRRGFRAWLLSRGYSKRIASVWLGHNQPETRMADVHYGGEKHIDFEAPVKAKKIA